MEISGHLQITQKRLFTASRKRYICQMQEGSYPVLVGSAEMPDAIDVPQQTVASDAVFDLAGRRVNNSQLKNGIYIVRGKKVLFK